MKKYNNKQDTGGYGGCVIAGLQLTFIISMIVVICVVLFSCSSYKYGCPSENQKVLNKSANRPFNK